MGIAVFAGMLGVTFFGLVLTPVFYVVMRRLAAGRAPVTRPALVAPPRLPQGLHQPRSLGGE